jgi:hypothetical protein
MHEKPARVARFHTDSTLRAGDEVTLFNGRGGEYAGRIAAVDRLQKKPSRVLRPGLPLPAMRGITSRCAAR